jgi:23S rRNA (cytidine2498-2'-O)-methyltransferase
VIRAAYLAAEGFEAALAGELAYHGVAVSAWHGRLALSPDPPIAAAWALDIWLEPREIEAPSIKSAADALRAIQRNWALYGVAHHRRAALIAERLPPIRARSLIFPTAAPTAALGAWTLLAPDRLLLSPTKSNPFPNGEVVFAEDRVNPPSRAYLKLWEALSRAGEWPGPGTRCLDLGASPGGWTWALARLGAEVTAIDRAPLTPAIAAIPGVSVRQGDAFAMPVEPVDWLCSDVVAYPDRMLGLLRRWIEAKAARRIVCTIKFQGDTDHATTAELAAIPGARLWHLWHNKHETTFLWGFDQSSAR